MRTAALLLLLVSPALLTGQSEPRPTNPLAPSLPLLTAAEEKRIEKIIDRFIQFDIGELKGGEGKKALDDFNALGSEATFLLIEGLNKAANLASSCPAVLIGKKLGSIVNSTRDVQLLEAVRENVGAGVTVRRHMGVIQDLKVGCILRRGYLQRNGLAQTYPVVRTTAQYSLKELVDATNRERGPKLRQVLTELEKRQGPVVIHTLATAVAVEETKELGEDLLRKHLMRLTALELRKQFKHPRSTVRIAAADVVATKRLPLGGDLIGLLQDKDANVQQAARQGLVALSGGQDFGPSPNSSTTERAEAIRQWRAWWQKQNN